MRGEQADERAQGNSSHHPPPSGETGCALLDGDRRPGRRLPGTATCSHRARHRSDRRKSLRGGDLGAEVRQRRPAGHPLTPAEVRPKELPGIQQVDDSIDVEFTHDVTAAGDTVDQRTIRRVHVISYLGPS